jgi:hypothetical protein
MKTAVDRAFVLIFAMLIVAPLLQTVTGFIREPMVEERREAQSIPELPRRLLALDPTLASDVNGWFNDRYGFRSVLIRLHNEVDYQAFSASDRVLIGRDGWLFDKDFVNTVVKDANNAELEPQILRELRRLRDCLMQRGVKLVFVLNPTKSSIYPQFLPVTLPLDPPPRLSRRLAAALQQEPGITFIDGEEILSRHRDEEVFYKTDIHMNLKGSSYVYRELIRQIAQLSGRPVPILPPEKWSIVKWDGGSEARFLAKLFRVEGTGYIAPSTGSAFKNDEYGVFDDNLGSAGLPQHPDLPLYDWIFTNTRPDAELLPAIMLFGTSFSDGLFDLRYNDVFAKIYRTRSNVAERIGPLLQQLPADVQFFVLEFPEVYVPLMLNFGTVCRP